MYKKHEQVPRSSYKDGRLMGNLIISGKWTWVTSHHEGRRNDVHRFKVTYLTPQGVIKKCLAHSPLTSDVITAMSIVS